MKPLFKNKKLGIQVFPTFQRIPRDIGDCVGLPPPFKNVNIQSSVEMFWWFYISRHIWMFYWDKSIKNLCILHGLIWFHHQDYLPMNYALLRVQLFWVIFAFKRPAKFWYKEDQCRHDWKLEFISLPKVFFWQFRDIGTSYCGDKPEELK